MPLYQWQCECGATFERFYKMADKPQASPCDCGNQARQQVIIGGIQGDELPAWFNHPHARGSLQPASERPIQSRSEMKAYMKARGIAESSARREV